MLQKGQAVTYRVRKLAYGAVVRAVHRDGSVTIEATHQLRGGKPYGCYLGYRYRLARSYLRVAA